MFSFKHFPFTSFWNFSTSPSHFWYLSPIYWLLCIPPHIVSFVSPSYPFLTRVAMKCLKGISSCNLPCWHFHNFRKANKIWTGIWVNLSLFFLNKISPLLCGFHSQYGAQHAFLNLINKWQSYLNESGIISTIFMDLFKTFDCLPHKLMLAKVHVSEIHKSCLELL